MSNSKKRIFYTENIEMRFGGLYALRDISIDIFEDEILGIIGPNGSGKTTLFNVITGFYKPTAGNFYFMENSLNGKEPYEITERGISRTYQISRLCLNLTVLDNVLIGTYFRQRTGYLSSLFDRKKLLKEVEEFKRRAIHLLEVFNPGIIDRLYEPVGALPQIDRRRVEICRAMIAIPKIILLDEPSAGMNPDETDELMKDIWKLKSEMENVTIVIIEHDMSVISAVSERVIVLNFGRKITEGTYEEVCNNKEVRESYLGKEFVYE